MKDTFYKKTIIQTGITIIMAAIIFAGCSGGSNPVATNPGTPDLRLGSEFDDAPGRISWGYWNITIDPESMTAQVVPDREAQLHYNVLQMLEGWACADCVNVPKIEWLDLETLAVDVSIRHPYPLDRQDLTGRDVRGIAIFEGKTLFAGHFTDDPDGKPQPLFASRTLLNPDGYTTKFNRWTADEGTGLFDYKRGRFTPDSEVNIQGNLHGFKYFYTNEYKRLFAPGQTVTETYNIAVEKFKPFSFGYSIDASWSFPLNWPVTNPVADFSLSASALEVYDISMSIGDNTLTRQSGSADLTFDLFDHQGIGTISTIEIEAPDLFPGMLALDPSTMSQLDLESGRITTTIFNLLGNAKTADGGSDILVVIEDIGASVSPQELIAYDIFTLPVIDTLPQWRPRDNTFLSRPFSGPQPQSPNLDFTVISDPQAPWAIEPGESMLVFLSDNDSKYLAYDNDLQDWTYLSGYPAGSGSWLKPTRRIDAATTGAFGVTSYSDYPLGGGYAIENATNMHLNGGLYNISWHTSSLNDPISHLEKAVDMSGGFGDATGNPLYSIYVHDSASSLSTPGYQSIHRIAAPYNNPDNVLRAFVPLIPGLSGNLPPYGVASNLLVAMGIDDDPPGVISPTTVHVYTGENRQLGLGANQTEVDIFEVNFTNPVAFKLVRNFPATFMCKSVPSPLGDQGRLVDIDVLPAGTNAVYLGNGQHAEHNWFVVLVNYDNWQHWYVEIWDPLDEGGFVLDSLKYVIQPVVGNAYAIDVDPDNFEIYVLHDDGPSGTGALQVSCFEFI
ncbi:MAG TPA: hypothetical protein VGB30_14935 [bacterium]